MITEEQFTEFLEHACTDVDTHRKVFPMNRTLVDLFRRGATIETDHFVLTETTPNVFEWLEKKKDQ